MIHKLCEGDRAGIEQIQSISPEQPNVLTQVGRVHGRTNGVDPSHKSIAHHSHISTLPPELLIFIFAQISKSDPIRQVWDYHILGWYVVAHVCRRWRDVANGSPILWQHIDFSLGPAWVPDMLARAKSHPVTIHKMLPYTEIAPESDIFLFDPDLELLKAHLFHIEALDLSGDPGELTLALQALNAPAPILDRLHLFFFRYPWPSKYTPSQFFGDHYPRLRTLSLTDFVFEQPVNFPTAGLVNLYIKFNGSAKYRLSKTFDGLLDLLQSSPTLQFLHISETSTSVDLDFESWTSHRVVKLSHLSRLHLDCGKYVFLVIIDHLEIPPSAILDLTVNPDFHCTMPQMHAALALVSNHVHTFAPIQTLSLKYEDHRNDTWFMEALAWSSCGGTDDPCGTGTPVLRLAGEWMYVTFLPAIDLTSRICAALPLASVRTLSVASPHWTAAQWADLFARCGALAHVHAAGEAAGAFVRAVEALGGDVLPGLETIALAGVDMREREPALGGILVAWLRRRAELRRLRLISCPVSPDDVAAMARSVGTVEVFQAPDDVNQQ